LYSSELLAKLYEAYHLGKAPMKKLSILVSLTTNDNDYQIEQAISAEEAARRTGVDLKIIYADNDAINQSQQLLKIIQSASTARPDAIVFEPAGSTALPQVAKAAASAGIGWVVLNRETDYVAELRNKFKVPVFVITADHKEIGKIQGKQIGVLLPSNGSILYIQGPSGSDAATQRTEGMQQSKPFSTQVRMLRAQWTEGSAYQAVSAWLRLSTSREMHMDAVVAQDDSMAMGARKAFQDISDSQLRDRWLALPFLGCDGMPKTGQAWVRSGLLAATVIVPPNAGLAIDMLSKATQTGAMPSERTLTDVRSFPPLQELDKACRMKSML
jgi:ABC-type sugar transport system substrate-binding protein